MLRAGRAAVDAQDGRHRGSPQSARTTYTGPVIESLGTGAFHAANDGSGHTLVTLG
ncbi:hypothetical protein [Limobrevibacterium gyesilva]|uniref:hypothetical protein n=1 Tax=Limobrevibacterium gyesilva TaxID=2991712 RepID=UPI0022275F47|nr:hypothetical protein [Limobrevibacterium gyesilva]